MGWDAEVIQLPKKKSYVATMVCPAIWKKGKLMGFFKWSIKTKNGHIEYYRNLMTDSFGTWQIIFGNNMNAIGYHSLVHSGSLYLSVCILYCNSLDYLCFLFPNQPVKCPTVSTPMYHRCVLWSCIIIPQFWMCFYSIHVVVEYNLAGSEIIWNQIGPEFHLKQITV